MRIPEIVHAEIVQGILNDKGGINRKDRRRIIASRRNHWRRKVPTKTKLMILNSLKERG